MVKNDNTICNRIYRKKLCENKDFIRYTFYELRVKENLSEDEVITFLEMNKN